MQASTTGVEGGEGGICALLEFLRGEVCCDKFEERRQCFVIRKEEGLSEGRLLRRDSGWMGGR